MFIAAAAPSNSYPAMDTLVHTVGTRVWIRDEREAWIKGEVVRVEEDALVVRAEDSGAEVKCKPEDAPLQNPHNNRGVDVSQSCGVNASAAGLCQRTGPVARFTVATARERPCSASAAAQQQACRPGLSACS